MSSVAIVLLVVWVVGISIASAMLGIAIRRRMDEFAIDLHGPALSEIPAGLYELTWKSGGRDLAVVGLMGDGRGSRG
jgi:hypothetical protein